MASRSPTLSQEARDSVPGTPEAGADSQPGPGVFCKLCLSEQPSAATSQLQSCNCNFCTACLQQYVQLAIMEGGGAPITCPDMACQKTGVLLDSEIASLAAADQVELYQRLKFERGVKLDPSRAWCPVVECQAVCSVQPGSEGQPSAVRCPTCHTVFCSGCRGPWQDSHTCPERQPMMSPSPSHESRGRSYSHSDMPIKQCPMCGIYIERNQGCAQMLCKSCKHTFCWYCLQNLDGDIFLRHYDKGPCRNKLGHSRASVMWNRTQVRPLRRPQSGPKLCPSSGATVTFIIPVGHLRQFDVQVQRGFRIRVTSLSCPDCCIVNYFEPLHLLKLGLPHT